MISRAHPHSRGENVFKSSADQMKAGSSPLTRGKRRSGEPLRRGRGLIPAHAGKTTGRAQTADPRRAHPRSRGENLNGQIGNLVGPGSSPLTRGKRGEVGGHANEVGLIPAHAGKKSSPCHARPVSPAHPRSRGENWAGTSVMGRTSGSSPLMREKRGVLLRALSGPGLIPAHAGKTYRLRGSAGRRPAHPRSHGENSGSRGRGPRIVGSSPLTRGSSVPHSGVTVGGRPV